MTTSLKEAQERVAQEMQEGMGSFSKERLSEVVYAGVFEEAGEIAGVHKRMHRRFERDSKKATREHLEEEIGDLLWYLLALCEVEDISIQEIYDNNFLKLEERYGHNQSSGSL